jgi:hypothetical protein
MYLRALSSCTPISGLQLQAICEHTGLGRCDEERSDIVGKCTFLGIQRECACMASFGGSLLWRSFNIHHKNTNARRRENER